MKLLLDECIAQDFRHLLVGHDVYTVGYVGWSGTKNGALLARASDGGFEAVITTDRKIEREQNLATLPIAVVVLLGASNDIDDLAPLVAELLQALRTLRPRTIIHVGPIAIG